MTLTFDILTLTFYSTSGVMCLTLYWAKSNNPRLSYWRFSTFSPFNLGVGVGGTLDKRFSGVRGPNFKSRFNQTWPGHTSIIATLQVVSAFGYLLHFQTRAAQNCVMLKTTPNFALFDSPSVKIRVGWGRSLDHLLKLYLRPNLRNTFDGHPLHGCWTQCADKKEGRKEERKFIS